MFAPTGPTSQSPPASNLVENLAALWAVDPKLAVLVDAVTDDAALPLEPTRSGHLTAAVTPANAAAAIYLHSRYDPQLEADRQTARVPADRLELFLLGLGLGYHAAALLKKAPAAHVWAFEPDLRVVRAALETNDFATAILERKLLIVHTLDKSKLFGDWMPHLAGMTVGQEKIEHAVSVQLHADYFTGVRLLLEEFLGYGKTTMNTLLLNSRRTCENLARNIPWYAASPGIGRLKDVRRGKPAIIVSAGPSLRKNKHLLTEASGKAVIIAVQTAFQQVVDLGVQPDFVTSLDYHDISTQFFHRIPKTNRTELVAEPKATPKIFDLHPGPLSILGSEFIESLLREMKLDRPTLTAGATVAHLAFYLAEHLGCDPVIFIGQDLGFSDGLAYAPGAAYDEIWRPELGRFNSVETMQWQRIVRDRQILKKTVDYQGRPIYTEQRLYSYLQQFERDFGKSGRTIIDATEGGVAKTGAAPMTLAAALNQYCTAPLGDPVAPNPGLDWQRLPQAETSLRNRLDEGIRVEQISHETLSLLKEITESLDDQQRVNTLIGRIDRLRAQMNELDQTYGLITQMTQRSELDRFAADRRIEAAGIDGVEKQRRQLLRDIDNVDHVRQAACVFQALMRRCIEETGAIAKQKAAM